MKTTSINGSKRASIGTKDAKELRRANKVPCVLYGGEAPIHFSADAVQFNKIVYTPDTYKVTLDLDGEKHDAVIQEKQFHPVTDNLLHMDFLEVSDNKEVVVQLPVALEGSAIGVLNGGKLRNPLRKLKVRGKVSALPENITIDIEKLRIGRSIKVADLSEPGVEFLDAINNVVVAVKMARGAVDEVEEEAAEEETAEAAAE